jgi:diphosphomevalonate decarboxylase
VPITRQQIVNSLVKDLAVPSKSEASAYAPTNIALCKYWGKRNSELNLPTASSLSISLGHLGACTKVAFADGANDQISLNNLVMAENTVFYRRIVEFLDFFRPTTDTVFKVTTQTNIPVAAGLASSACGFAALVKALHDLFAWPLSLAELSILARLGSGSACRSLWDGFVLWEAGQSDDGMDSYAQQLTHSWPELRVGLLLVDNRQKSVSSREAMQASVATSPFYPLWPTTVQTAIEQTQQALAAKDFWTLGSVAEANALAMHSLMLSTTPPIIYSQAATLDYMRQIWRARAEGLSLFFTQDAGPNLKLLFLDKDEAKVRELFTQIEIVAPFATIEQPVECIYE